MNYISLFSGIEAASVAWASLGWNPVAFAEIEPFCCELLERRFPNVPNLGDVSGVDWTEYEGSVDVVIGGSPCQAFSMAGRRLGLMDERGQLMLEFVRCVREVRPRWVIWENVPGVLSQDKGRAFGTLLGELEDCGYALAWRVLDAQFFGVPQRRRRVFLVGHPVPGCAAGVLFEPSCMRGDNPPSREKRAQLAADAESCAPGSYTLKLRHTGSPCIGGGSGPLIQDDLSATLATSQDQILFQPKGVLPFNATQITSKQNGNNPQWGDACHTLAETDRPPHIVASKHDPTYAISGNIIGREPENGGHHLGIEDDGAMFTLTTADRHAVAFSWNAANSFTTGEDVSPTLKASHSSEPAVCMASGQANAEHMEECCPTQSARQYKDPPIVALSNGDDVCGTLCARDYKGVGYIVRRLMPVECERLQGFPDGWTDLGGSPDAPRYKACGNSMAVPVINYIGRRIEAVDAI